MFNDISTNGIIGPIVNPEPDDQPEFETGDGPEDYIDPDDEYERREERRMERFS